jgi:flagellar biosynthesis protein FliQ
MLGETMLLPALIILMVLAPVLVPAIITAVHVLTGQARTSTQDRVATNFPRRIASPRLAIPAAA